jgi:hypothetical protein
MGKTLQDDQFFLPLGPEILDIEISKEAIAWGNVHFAISKTEQEKQKI